MTLERMVQLLDDDENGGEFLKFDRVALECRMGVRRPDLCAFLILDRLVPGAEDIVSGSRYDEIMLSIDTRELAASATERDILNLSRCGVRYDSGYESLRMLVSTFV